MEPKNQPTKPNPPFPPLSTPLETTTPPKLLLLYNLLLLPLILTLTLLLSLPLKIYHFTVTHLMLPLNLLPPNQKTIKTLLSPLTPYDAIFAVDDPTHPHAANTTLIYLSSRIELKEVKSRFQKLLKKPGFQKLKWIYQSFYGIYFWAVGVVEFDLEEHFEEVVINGDLAELHEFLSGNMVRGFKVGRPFWDVRVVQLGGGSGGVVRGEEKSIIVIRIHHTYADGYSQNAVVDELLGVKSGYLVKRGGRWEGWGRKVHLFLTSPLLLLTLYRDALTTPPNIFTQKKQSSTGLISITTLNLEELKSLRRQTGVHFATLGMCLMAGAMRRYFLWKGKRIDSLPSNVSVMHSLPKEGHPLVYLTNHWGVGLFRVGLGDSGGGDQSSLDRLLQTEANFMKYVNEGYDEILHWHMPILGWVPRGVLRWFFNINFGTGCGFTSVPGVAEGVVWGTSFGNEVRVEKMAKVFGFQWGQTALATAVYTHNNQATISLYANKDIVDGGQGEMEQIVGGFLREEFEGLKKGVVSGGVVGGAKRGVVVRG